MTIYFADTSAFAKRYLPEAGSDWVESWIDPAARHVTVISALGTIEFMALLSRRRREGSVVDNDFDRLRNDFAHHVEHQYQVIELAPSVLARARELVLSHPLRTLDALQLAAALTAAEALGSKPVFVAADYRLLDAAAVEGFPTANPLDHT